VTKGKNGKNDRTKDIILNSHLYFLLPMPWGYCYHLANQVGQPYFRSNRMPDGWRRSTLVPIFKNKGDIQSCTNYRGIKLMSHTMKLWERVIEHGAI
jgi:hypothetical protein